MTDESAGKTPQIGAPATPDASPGGRLATILALILGFCGMPLIAFYVHWHEAVILRSLLHTTFMSLTPIVFFPLVLLVGGVNPLIKRFFPGWALGRRQIVLIFSLWTLTAVTCYTHLASPALFSLGVVNAKAMETPTTRRADLTSYLKPNLFPPETAANQYYYGVGNSRSRVPPSEVPWSLWFRPLVFWAPFMAVIVIMSAAIVRTVHRQWSRHELLPFPLADVTDSVLRQRSRGIWPDFAYSRAFWCGFVMIVLMYLINGLRTWFPQMIEIPTSYWYKELLDQFSFLASYCGPQVHSFFRGIIYPFLVCIVVFLPTDISLTCWLGWVLMVLGTGAYFLLTGEAIGPTETNQLQAGAYVAMGVIILYIGRHEYRRILAYAFRSRVPQDSALRSAVAACRVYLICCAILASLLMYAGFHWMLALFLTAAFSLNTLLIARVTAEFGIPWLINFAGKATLLPVQMLGTAAIGPKGLALMSTLGLVLDFDPRNSVAAQQTTTSKLVEEGAAVTLVRRRNGVLLAGLCIALACAIFFTLWSNYSFGARIEEPARDGLAEREKLAGEGISRLKAEGLAQVPGESSSMSRLGLVRAEPKFWRFFLYGAALVGACAFMRLRFTWWPFHPLVFIFFGTFGMGRLYVSFFLGWIIKVALTKIGGGQFYVRSKPFFVGVITGQIIMAGVWVIVGDIYYIITGTASPVTRFIM
jgi:hypothetical protein